MPIVWRNDRDGESRFRRPPTGPSVAPPRTLDRSTRGGAGSCFPHRRPYWSVAIFLLLISGVRIHAYRDLSRPDAWDYWKDLYVSPSLTSSLIAKLDLDGAASGRRALSVSGTIGPAAANWFRERAGRGPSQPRRHDPAVLPRRRSQSGRDHGRDHPRRAAWSPRSASPTPRASPAGLLRQRLRARLCRRQTPLSACWARRSASIALRRTKPVGDPVAETQRIAGAVLGYHDAKWASRPRSWRRCPRPRTSAGSPQEAPAMNLITGMARAGRRGPRHGR